MIDAAKSPDPAPQPSRRPLGSRNSGWAVRLAGWAVVKGITPNQISLASVGFAAVGLIFFVLSPFGPAVLQGVCLILAGAMVQARLVCNLIDGMVAIETGWVVWKNAPVTARLALPTVTVPETGCVACQNVPVTPIVPVTGIGLRVD